MLQTQGVKSTKAFIDIFVSIGVLEVVISLVDALVQKKASHDTSANDKHVLLKISFSKCYDMD